jgi:thiamine biosynthesis lipoprotein
MSLEFHAMGSQMLAASDADSPTATARLEQVPHWFETWESRLSRFRVDSELTRLSRADGEPVAVSNVLWDALQTSLKAARLSDGLVIPTMAPWVEAAGYDRTFAEVGQAVSTRPFPERSAQEDWRAIRLDGASRSVTLPNGCRLDLGGTAKGWAADRAVRRLKTHGPALVNAGGDVAVHGPRPDGRGWAVGVSDPANPDRALELLCLSHGGVATSGRDVHRWIRGGRVMHHIIDPRTGLPAATDVLSTTVVAPTTVEAEVAAKVVVILGSVAGLAWLESHSPFAALLVLEDGRVVRSHRFRRYVWR